MTNEEQARVAAKWWRGALSGPANLDNGDDSQIGGMAVILAAMTQPAIPSDEALRVFEGGLRSAIMTELDGSGRCFLDCDYHPDRILGAAAQAAGIEARCPPFPWKTSMTFRDGEVRVSHGYGADYVKVAA